MKCPSCNSDLFEKDNIAFCPKCSKCFDEKEIKNIIDAEMINADHEVYKKFMQYKGRS